MKVAHIVPPNALLQVEKLLGDYHLCLPSLTRSTDYTRFYSAYTLHPNSAHVILDNGVAEGYRTDFAHLLHIARVLNASEVVLPDILRDGDATLEASADAFYEAFRVRQAFRFMLVCQGTTVVECASTAERAMHSFPGIIGSFGVPRHILSLRPTARLEIVQRLWGMFPRIPIHLLGTYPAYPGELKEFGHTYRSIGVRGVDTSLAWAATRQDLVLGSHSLDYNTIIERQSVDEFRTHIPTDDEVLRLRENMEVISSWIESTH
jgi:hypothetical protein